MKVKFGAGLLNILPPEMFVVEDEPLVGAARFRAGQAAPPKKKDTRSPSKERKFSYFSKVSELGLSQLFAEIIEDEVAEFRFDANKVTGRWLPPAEGLPIIAAARKLGGELPYSAIPKGFDPDFCFPAYLHHKGQTVTLPELTAPCYTMGSRMGLQTLQRGMAEVPSMDRDFVNELLETVRQCLAHRMIFWLWFE